MAQENGKDTPIRLRVRGSRDEGRIAGVVGGKISGAEPAEAP